MTVSPDCRLSSGLSRSGGCPLDRGEACDLCCLPAPVGEPSAPGIEAAAKAIYDDLLRAVNGGPVGAFLHRDLARKAVAAYLSEVGKVWLPAQNHPSDVVTQADLERDTYTERGFCQGCSKVRGDNDNERGMCKSCAVYYGTGVNG